MIKRKRVQCKVGTAGAKRRVGGRGGKIGKRRQRRMAKPSPAPLLWDMEGRVSPTVGKQHAFHMAWSPCAFNI